MLRRTYEAEPSLGGKRSLSFLPITRVAGKISRVAQAGEHLVSDAVQASALSYAPQVREMLATTPARELLPQTWLSRLRDACKLDGPAESLGPGTHMVAFYTRSTRTGLQILMPAKGFTYLPPCVKISEAALPTADWTQLCELEAGLNAGKALRLLPKNWSDAKSWMGPEVGPERQFSTVQKFFYGITSLRQRLEVKCTAIRDDLRCSGVDAATASLAALGGLFKQEIVLADPEGKVQLLLMCRHYSVEGAEEFPSSLQWHPLPFFEARHYAKFTPSRVQATSLGKALVFKSNELQSAVAKPMLRDSDLRSSGGSSCPSMHSSVLSHPMAREALKLSGLSSVLDGGNEGGISNLYASAASLLGQPLPPDVGECFNDVLQTELTEAWEPLRWTKRVVLAVCRVSDLRLSQDGESVKEADNYKCPTASAQQRVKDHVRTHREVAQQLGAAVGRLRKSIKQLEAAVHDQQMAIASE